MRRIALGTFLLLVAPVTSGAETSRERSFAICLTITPGLGAASLGHPGRGAANFALYTGGTAALAFGATDIDEKGRPNGGLMAVGGAAMFASFLWAFVDGVSLEASEDFTYVRPLPRDWRPGLETPRPQATPPPMPGATPIDVRPPHVERPEPEPTPPQPLAPHVPDPSGKAFIKTGAAGLQQVEVGRYVRALRTDGSEVVGTIHEVSEVAIVVDPGDGSSVMIRAGELRQVNAARKP